MSRSGIVNVRMVITEEKILSNIDKVQKLIWKIDELKYKIAMIINNSGAKIFEEEKNIHLIANKTKTIEMMYMKIFRTSQHTLIITIFH